MVTILAGTALDITLEQKKQLVERVSSAISKINSEYSFFLLRCTCWFGQWNGEQPGDLLCFYA